MPGTIRIPCIMFLNDVCEAFWIVMTIKIQYLRNAVQYLGDWFGTVPIPKQAGRPNGGWGSLSLPVHPYPYPYAITITTASPLVPAHIALGRASLFCSTGKLHVDLIH